MPHRERPEKAAKPEKKQRETGPPQDAKAKEVRPEVVALIRMLLREPPPGHDFKTCPICKRHGITGI